MILLDSRKHQARLPPLPFARAKNSPRINLSSDLPAPIRAAIKLLLANKDWGELRGQSITIRSNVSIAIRVLRQRLNGTWLVLSISLKPAKQAKHKSA
jgi:hypothetical protein